MWLNEFSRSLEPLPGPKFLEHSWSVVSGGGNVFGKAVVCLWWSPGSRCSLGSLPPPATPGSCVRGDVPVLRGSMDVPMDVFDPGLVSLLHPQVGHSFLCLFSTFLQGSAIPGNTSLAISSLHLSQHLPCCPSPAGIKVYFCPSLLYPIRGIRTGASGPRDLPCDSRSFFRLRPRQATETIPA